MLGHYLDLGNPVSSHPLNAGLVGWWLGLPNNSGGARLFDITRGNNATFASGGSGAIPAWAADTKGFRAVNFDGATNGYYAQTASAANLNAAALTVSVWFRDLGGNSDNGGGMGTDPRNWDYVAGYGGYNSGGGGWELGFRSSTTVQWVVWSGTGFTSFGLVGSTLTTGTGWNHALLTSTTTGPSNIAYFNGVASGSAETATTRNTTSNYMRLAKRPADGESYTAAVQVGSVRVFNRVLSASEAWADYEQAARGHPDTLRRWSRKVWVSGGVASASALTGSGTSAGVALGTGVGRAEAAGYGASAGSATGTPVGRARAAGYGSSAGAAAGAGGGLSRFVGSGAAPGVASVAGAGRSEAAGYGASAGAGVASPAGRSEAAGYGSSVGSAAGTPIGRSKAAGYGASAGVASVNGVSATGGTGSSAGSSAGTGIGRATAAGYGAANGAGASNPTGRSAAAGYGASNGLASVVGSGTYRASGYGSSGGAAAGSGTGRSSARGYGAPTGASANTGAGRSGAAGYGAANGAAQASPNGASTARGYGGSVGIAAGDGFARDANATSLFTDRAPRMTLYRVT